jgi:hypothetical protein
MWSVVEKTSLAEAEIEYQDYQSDMVWVAFPVTRIATTGVRGIEPGTADEAGRELVERAKQLDVIIGASIVIWTTTPWTLPGNRAISYSRRISYGLYEVMANERDFGPKIGARYVIADKLAEEVAKQAKITLARTMDVTADMLAGVTCAHPLAAALIPPPSGEGGPERSEGSEGGRPALSGTASVGGTPSRLASGHPPSPQGGGMGAYAFDVPLLDGDHVTDDAGTGFVHTAPGHGREDFDIWMRADTQQMLRAKGIPADIPYTVDADGFFTADAPGFTGKSVITHKGEKGDANEAVIAALIAAGNLVARGRLKHQYPHSWRSKKPVIFRNTPQWFIAMDRPFAASSPSPREAAGRAGVGGGSTGPALAPEASASASAANDDLLLVVRRVEALTAFLATEDGANLLAGYKRAANILRAEEKKDGEGAFAGAADPALLAEPQEKALHAALAQALPEAQAAAAGERYGEALAALSRLRAPVDAFFDKVTVNAPDPALRANRLRLLSTLRAATLAVADFGKISG